MIELSGLEQDTLSELINIGVGRAAASLSEMIEQEVLLDVPVVEFETRARAAEKLGQKGAVSAVSQSFSGPFDGDAWLIFPEMRSLELVRHLVKIEIPLESLSDLEQEALMEVGNIILNACLGSIGNLLEERFECALPIYRKTRAELLLEAENGADEQMVMLLTMRFHMQHLDIEGYVLFVMDIESMQALKALVTAYLAKVMGG